MKETVYLAAGCFWSVEYRLSRLPGVLKTQVGYAGGTVVNPSYKQVCLGNTGHTETVEVVFDSTKLSFLALLEEFFALHDPTQLNHQGPDVGTNYRSAIFVTTAKQYDDALNYINEKAVEYDSDIVTELNEFESFYPAEEYHQSYIAKKRGEC